MPAVVAHKAPASHMKAMLAPMPAGLTVWHKASLAPLNLTYKFEAAQPSDLWNKYGGWTAFTDAQKDAVRAVLAEIASVCNLAFTETTGADPDLNLGRVTLPSAVEGQGGYTYGFRKNAAGAITAKIFDGFAVFNNKDATISANTILHEVGHALMLKHPGNYNGEGTAPPGPFLPRAYDSNKYSVMSYRANPDNKANSDHLMLYDIAALQARFGANYRTATGDDTYYGPQGRISVIWDAGGVDQISGARFAAPVGIDLRDGKFSSLGAKHNLAIAFGVVIENGAGGSGNDALIGNQFANRLDGGAGNDVLSGLAGRDILAGGPGADKLTGGPAGDQFLFDTALAVAGVDRVMDFARAQGDKVVFDDAIFNALTPGALPATAFFAGGAAHDGDDHVIYNARIGALLYDPDGDLGTYAAVKIAQFKAGLALAASDFFVV